MRELKIACGNSRQAKIWKNRTVSFEELCARLKDPVRTPETAEEYGKLPKTERNEIKDKGGFVAGCLKDGLRQKDSVECRSMLVYDLDGLRKDFLIEDHIRNACVWYTTHSHTPENPRVRILLPLTRDLTPDEFNAASRFYASDNGILGMLDACSFSPNQMMYWPTCSSDGEYLSGTVDGDWLDPDTVLAAHPDWRNCSALPLAAEEKAAAGDRARRQKDPLEKDGIVGAVCRAYPIRKVIDRYLSDIYTPAADGSGRYDYIPGEGSNGVVIYDDKFAFSHHSTDPAGGILCNSFDLVRIHKFGDMGEKKSFSAAAELFSGDQDVRSELLREKQDAAGKDFENWEQGLEYDKRGALKNNLHNLVLIMENDTYMKNIVFNQQADSIEVIGKLPWKHPDRFWRDADDAQLMRYIDTHYGTFTVGNYQTAVTAVTDDRSYHPIRDYFRALPEWDGVPRVDNLLVEYLGAVSTPYIRAVTRKILCGAIARVMQPGVKFDYILVLNGAQGIGKSTLISKLGGEWYSDSLTLTDMNDKTAAEKLQGYWILEIGELAGMKRADIDRVKAFISRQDDKYRAAFGHRVYPHPRQCVFFGTTNAQDGFLRDITGNRRFWTVEVSGSGKRKPWDMTDEDIRQIWAEAASLYEGGEKLYLPPELEEAARHEQIHAMEKDDREGLVRDYLEILLPENWAEMDLYDRRSYLNDPGNPTRPRGVVRRDSVCNLEIWCECFGRNKDEIRPADSFAIAGIMLQIEGWVRSDERRKHPIYGRQRIYRRQE